MRTMIGGLVGLVAGIAIVLVMLIGGENLPGRFGGDAGKAMRVVATIVGAALAVGGVIYLVMGFLQDEAPPRRKKKRRPVEDDDEEDDDEEE